MRNALDTFVHYIADNLKDKSGTAIAVHECRKDKDNPGAALLQMNSVNVKALNPDFSLNVSSLIVSLDVINDDELTAIDWVEQVWKLLSAVQFTPKYDWSPLETGGTKVALGSNVFWKPTTKFRDVKSDYYSHFTTTVRLFSHIY